MPRGFEPISAENRRVLVQEWLAEALTMWGVAGVVIVTTAVGGAQIGRRVLAYRGVAGLLVVSRWPFSPLSPARALR